MSVQITLDVPDAVYKKAQETAEARNRPIRELLSELIVEAFPQIPHHPHREAILRETELFRQHKEQYQAKYPDMELALINGEVIDFDSDLGVLMQRVRAKYGEDQPVLFCESDYNPDRILHFRSPRIVRS